MTISSNELRKLSSFQQKGLSQISTICSERDLSGFNCHVRRPPEWAKEHYEIDLFISFDTYDLEIELGKDGYVFLTGEKDGFGKIEEIEDWSGDEDKLLLEFESDLRVYFSADVF